MFSKKDTTVYKIIGDALFNEKVIYSKKLDPKNYAIASLITAKNRVNLNKLINFFQKNNCRILAVHTDSITIQTTKKNLMLLDYNYLTKVHVKEPQRFDDIFYINSIVYYYKLPNG